MSEHSQPGSPALTTPPRLLRVATCQFSVEASIRHNQEQVLAQLNQAADRGARVVHFSEAALSGYAGVDFPGWSGFDWDALRQATAAICCEAARRKVWVLLGSAHRLSEPHLPHNCVYVVSDEGKVVDRYDKRFCTGRLSPEPQEDLCYYTPGNRPAVFTIDGFLCSVLICYDYRFPELYRQLKQLGVEVLFQSFHNARRDAYTAHHDNVWKDIVPATMMCHAATNYFWVSANNSTARYSMWPSFFVRPDGRIAGRLELHRPGVLVSDVAPSETIWDAPAPWRERAMQGVLHSGQLVEDPRSSDRTCY